MLTNDFDHLLMTPCGVLAPMLSHLVDPLQSQIVSREDIAIGLATGFALAGEMTAVLMQNTGFAQSVNALASLACPYRVPMLLVISLRGTDNDQTEENVGVGKLVTPILRSLNIPFSHFPEQLESVEHIYTIIREKSLTGPAALLIPPATFGWSP